MRDLSIITTYFFMHCNLHGFFLVSIILDIEVSREWGNDDFFKLNMVYNSKYNINDYCFIIALSFKSTSSYWSICALTTSWAPIFTVTTATIFPCRLNLMWFKFSIICSFSFKWNFSSLISIIWRIICIFCFLRAELCIISCSSFKSSSIWSV